MNNKKEKRRLRHLNNRNKDQETKQKLWDRGKLIYENHNDEFFSPEFSIKFSQRLVEKIKEGKTEFYKLKDHAINAVLLFNPTIEKTDEWRFLKQRLEDYWDGR